MENSKSIKSIIETLELVSFCEYEQDFGNLNEEQSNCVINIVEDLY